MPQVDGFVEAERRHYDQKAARNAIADAPGTYARFIAEQESGALRAAYNGWKTEISRFSSRGDLRVLDYCAGQGFHSITVQSLCPDAEVVGIDISGKSLDNGRRIAEQELKGKRPRFLEMDGHELTFPDGEFDLISDFGSFSSLDFDRAAATVYRVLKPGGTLIALETFGHNPVMNLKRKLNVLRGRRTLWAAQHILNESRLEKLKELFPENTIEYFGLVTPAYAALPVRSATALSWLERIDRALFRRGKWMETMAFKLLFVGRKPCAGPGM